MTKQVVGLAEVASFDSTPRDLQGSGAQVAPVGQLPGLQGIGCRYIGVEPGKRAYPFHNHLGNDELFLILEGSGTYLYGESDMTISAGDLCAASRGGPATAHQIISSSSRLLKYLAISTKRDPDICEYPDSDKFAAIAVRPGKDVMSAHMRFVGRMDSAVSYFDGEDL